MKRDTVPMRRSESTYDAIVVGSGAAGSWAVKELTEGGLKVVLLEAGRDLDLARDFPADAEVGVMGIGGRVKAAMHGQQVQVRCSSFSETTKQFYVSDRENPYTTARGRSFLWFRGRQLGGRLHTWWRHVPRMSNYELKAASVRGDGLDWPLSYEDLAPYYDVVERTLGVHGEARRHSQLSGRTVHRARENDKDRRSVPDRCRETTSERPRDVRQEDQLRQEQGSASRQARSGNRSPRDSDRRHREPIADRSAVRESDRR